MWGDEGERAFDYRGTLLTSERTPLGPYRRPMSRVLGGWAFSHSFGSRITRRESKHKQGETSRCRKLHADGGKNASR